MSYYKRVEKFVLKRVDLLESKRVGPVQWVVIFFSIVVFRNLLESFSGNLPVPEMGSFFLHYPFAFIPQVFYLIIVLSLFSGEHVSKVTKLMLFVWTLTLLPPLIDFLLPAAKPKVIGYLWIPPYRVHEAFLHFFDPFQEFLGSTKGIRIQFFVGCILAGWYVYLKSGNIFRTLGCIVIIYAVAIFLYLKPSMYIAILDLVGIKTSSVSLFVKYGSIMRSNFNLYSFSIAQIDLYVIILILALWFALYNKTKFLLLLKNMGSKGAIHFPLLVILGEILAIKSLYPPDNPFSLKNPMDLLTLITPILSVFFAYQFARLIDLMINQKGVPGLPPTELRGVALVFLLISLSSAITVNYAVLIFVLVFLGAYLFYHIPPFRLQQIFPFSSLLIAFASLMAIMTGYSVLGRLSTPQIFPQRVILLTLISYFLGINVKDAVTRVENKFTLFSLLKGNKAVIASLVALSFIIVPFFLVSKVWFTVVSLITGGMSLIFAMQLRKRPLYGVYTCYLLVLLVAFLLGGVRVPAPPVKATPLQLAHSYYGKSYERDYKFDHAVVEYQKAVELGTKDVETYLSLGFLLRQKGNLNGALAIYQRAQQLDPNNPKIYYDLGVTYRRQGEDEKFLQMMNKADSLDPGFKNIKYELALYYREKGQITQALKIYKDLLQKDSSDVVAANGIGLCYEMMKDYDKAVEQYKRALTIDPNSAPVRENLARNYLRKGQILEAIEEYKKAIQIDPDRAHLYVGLGSIYENKGDFKKAISCYKRVIQLNPEAQPIYNQIAICFDKLGDFTRAVRYLRRALRIDPKDMVTHYNLGIIYFHQGQWGKAEQEFGHANRINPQYPAPLYRLAIIKAIKGEDQQALDYLHQAIKNGGEKFKEKAKRERFFARLKENRRFRELVGPLKND